MDNQELNVEIMQKLVMGNSLTSISKKLNVSRYRVTQIRDILYADKETPNESVDIKIFRKIKENNSLRSIARDVGVSRYRVTKVRNTMNHLTKK